MTRWRAPGRINLIGEHTDYNDGFVLPLALSYGCVATVESAASQWRAVSAQQPEPVVVDPSGLPESPPGPAWASYVLGAAWLLHDRGIEVPALSIAVDSTVPLGAGLSSSAALVCSVVRALDDHLALDLDDAALLTLSREVENVAVGAPTGGMDQLVSLRGVAGNALFCDMRDLTTRAVPFDPSAAGLELVVVDTQAPHRHSDGEYGARRRGCEEAARQLGVGALRDVDDLDAALARLDDEELVRYVRHVVSENARVLATVDLLDAGALGDIGPLLTASHASMRDDFRITVPEVDRTVETMLELGALGARMTGGGFGGCVIGLVPSGATADVFERCPGAFVATAQQGAHRLAD